MIINAPTPLFIYDTETKNQKVMAWEIDPDGLTNTLYSNGITVFAGVLQQLNFNLQIDNTVNFNSINLKTFDNSSCEEYQNGKIVKAYTINTPKETIDGDFDYYWKVKCNSSGVTATFVQSGIEGVTTFDITSDYCDGQTFTVYQDETIELAHSFVDSIPDKNSYTKDEYSTKIYVLMRIFADEFKNSYDEIKYSKDSFVVKKCKEKYLSTNFGTFLNYTKSNDITFAEYRQILYMLMSGYEKAGTKDYIQNVLKYLLGYKPDLIPLKTRYNWLIGTNRDGSYETTEDYTNPAGRYFFLTSDYPDLYNSIRLFSRNYVAYTTIVQLKNVWRYTENELSLDKVQETIGILKPAYLRMAYNYYNYLNQECFNRYYYGIDYYLYSYYMSEYSDLPGFFD